MTKVSGTEAHARINLEGSASGELNTALHGVEEVVAVVADGEQVLCCRARTKTRLARTITCGQRGCPRVARSRAGSIGIGECIGLVPRTKPRANFRVPFRCVLSESPAEHKVLPAHA
jgi:hypothetical protein